MPFKNRILVIGLALACVAIYLYTAAPFMLWEDAPRFLAAIITLGIAKPAEPVYVFLAHWFTYLPFGSVIFRIQIFSALLAGGSLILLCRLVTRILEKPILPQKKNTVLLRQPQLMMAGVFSMLTLAFSYQFWSQAQNIETFILDCFIELVVLNLLISGILYKTVFKRLAIVAVICGIALGTDPPVIVSIFPFVLLVVWNWRSALLNKRIFILSVLGIAAIVLAWSYLPFAESLKPGVNYVNGATLQGIWDVATGQGQNFYTSSLNRYNGLTWSPVIMIRSSWRYLITIWLDFTPLLLPFILGGGIYFWRRKRNAFWLLVLVALTNLIVSLIYYSSNQESWFLQSDIIFAILAGTGYLWFTKHLAALWPRLNTKIIQIVLFAFAFTPLLYWWQTLDRHNWNFTQDYIDNIYTPVQSPAILFGSGDLWDATSTYIYYATNYRHSVIPVIDTWFYSSDWYRQNLSSSHINIPDGSYLKHSNHLEYSKFISDFFARNIGRYHIYVTQSAMHNLLFHPALTPSLLIDKDKFTLVPNGLLEEVIPKDKNVPEINLSSFNYRFGNNFPERKPFFVEENYTGEMDTVIEDVAFSYNSAANYLVSQGRFDEANTFYDKAFKLEPNEPQLIDDIGVSYSRQDKPTTALDYFRKAHKLQPNNLGFLYNLAITEGQLGQTDDEKNNLISILNSSNPDSTFKQLASERLNSFSSQVASHDAKIDQRPLSQGDTEVFKSEGMNLTFAYPKTLKLSQVDENTISLADSSYPSDEDKLLIYSANVPDWNAKQIYIPYSNLGQLTGSQSVQLPNFEGVLESYNDSPNILLLRHQQQLVAIRFPEHISISQQVISEILTSMTSLR